MAAKEKVASALNKLADRTFLDVLSPRDKSSMADLSGQTFHGGYTNGRGQRGRRGAW